MEKRSEQAALDFFVVGLRGDLGLRFGTGLLIALQVGGRGAGRNRSVGSRRRGGRRLIRRASRPDQVVEAFGLANLSGK